MAYIRAFQKWINNIDDKTYVLGDNKAIVWHNNNDNEAIVWHNNDNNIFPLHQAVRVNPFKKVTIPRGTKFCPSNRHSVLDDVNPVQNQESQYYLTLDEPLSFNIDDYCVLNVSINGTPFDVVGFDIDDEESVKKYEEVGNCKMPIFAPGGLRYHVNSPAKDPIGLIHSFENRQLITIQPNSTIILHAGTNIVLKTPVSEACVKDGKCPSCENYKNNNLYSKLLADVKAKF